MERKIAVVERKRCVACGACAKACPKAAIQIWKGCYAQIDGNFCVGCGKCAKTCPAGCITVKAREGAA